jgi:hypothetical protein
MGSGLGEEYVEPEELKAGEFRNSFPSLAKCQNMCPGYTVQLTVFF